MAVPASRADVLRAPRPTRPSLRRISSNPGHVTGVRTFDEKPRRRRSKIDDDPPALTRTGHYRSTHTHTRANSSGLSASLTGSCWRPSSTTAKGGGLGWLPCLGYSSIAALADFLLKFYAVRSCVPPEVRRAGAKEWRCDGCRGMLPSCSAAARALTAGSPSCRQSYHHSSSPAK